MPFFWECRLSTVMVPVRRKNPSNRLTYGKNEGCLMYGNYDTNYHWFSRPGWGFTTHIFWGLSCPERCCFLGQQSPKRVQLRQDQAKTGRVAPLVRRDPLPVSLDREETAPMGPETSAHERNGCMRLWPLVRRSTAAEVIVWPVWGDHATDPLHFQQVTRLPRRNYCPCLVTHAWD